MARLSDIHIVDEDGEEPKAGGAFVLDRPSPVSKTVEIGDGWTVEVRDGSRDVVARGGTATAYVQGRNEALSRAQRGLDMLSVFGDADLTAMHAGDDHLVWWLAPQGVVLRIVLIKTMLTVDVPPVRAIVTDSAGNVVSDPSRPATVWHPSFRYYRLAQATDDLFDAYRNLYLALESILDTVAPMKMKSSGKPDEGERVWLRRALGTTGTRINLAGFAPPGPGTPEDRIIDEHYQTIRTAIFHARGSRQAVLAGEEPVRQEVDAARKRLVKLYQALANEYLHVHRPEGGLYSMGFHQFVAGGLDKEEGRSIIHVTDEAELLPEGKGVGTVGKRVVPLLTQREPSLDEPFVKSFLGRSPRAELGGLPRIAQINATDKDGMPLLGFTFDAALTLSGVAVLEVHLGLRARNKRQPKELYGM